MAQAHYHGRRRDGTDAGLDRAHGRAGGDCGGFSVAHLVATRRLLVRAPGYDSAAVAVGLAPLLSAPRHQPSAPERRRAEPAEKEVQGLPYRLFTRRFCGGPDRRGQAIPLRGHRPHQQGGLR